MARVQGATFTMAESGGRFTGEGELIGEEWNWSSWRSTSSLPDGTRVESEDTIVGEGLQVEKKVFSPDGTLMVTISERFTKLSPEECAKRFPHPPPSPEAP